MRRDQAAPYTEGCWFWVPIEQGGAAGVVARRHRGVCLGYFFLLDQRPFLSALTSLRPQDAALVALFGDDPLVSGTWPVLGRNKVWRRTAWPIPCFARATVAGPQLMAYNEHLSFKRAWPVTRAEAARHPVEERLDEGAVLLRLRSIRGGLAGAPRPWR